MEFIEGDTDLEDIIVDRNGCIWRRTVGWIEPKEAQRIFSNGVDYFMLDHFLNLELGKREKFKKQILSRMLSTTEALSIQAHGKTKEIVAGEIWKQGSKGNSPSILVFRDVLFSSMDDARREVSNQ